MPRHSCSVEGMMRVPSKIRKRGCSSSSSSATTVMQKYRFKRALLVRKRGRLSTPVPIWKLSSRTPTSSTRNADSPKSPPSQNVGNGIKVPLSARKLAATLWEMNELPSPRMKKQSVDSSRTKNNKLRGDGRDVMGCSLPRRLSDPSHSSPASEWVHRSKTGPFASQKGIPANYNTGSFSSMSNSNLMEIAARSRGLIPTGSITGNKTGLKKLRNVMGASKELLKILSKIWGHKDRHSSGMLVLSALHVELDRAQRQINQLIHEQRSGHNEIDHLTKQFTKEKASDKSREEERIQAAIKSISGDLEMERKLRKRSENFTKTLLKELAMTKEALSKATKEVKSEKTAREIMEQVCDELARGIGEDRAEVEELKRKSAMVQEEVEKEREMLQLADMLREERVQMKLSEAKYQFEEKNAAVDKLRNELKAFLKNKQNDFGSQDCGSKREIEAHFSKLEDWHEEKRECKGETEDGDEELEEELTESDLHSIELNVDNTTKNCTWNYATGDSKKMNVEEGLKGRKSNSEKLLAGRISLERCSSDGIELDFSTGNLANQARGFDQRGFLNLASETFDQDLGVKFPSYDYVNGRTMSTKCFANPTQQRCLPLSPRETGNLAYERSNWWGEMV